jgi:hypothetical protein
MSTRPTHAMGKQWTRSLWRGSSAKRKQKLGIRNVAIICCNSPSEYANRAFHRHNQRVLVTSGFGNASVWRADEQQTV